VACTYLAVSANFHGAVQAWSTRKYSRPTNISVQNIVTKSVRSVLAQSKSFYTEVCPLDGLQDLLQLLQQYNNLIVSANGYSQTSCAPWFFPPEPHNHLIFPRKCLIHLLCTLVVRCSSSTIQYGYQDEVPI
jgi:hypothetical protein